MSILSVRFRGDIKGQVSRELSDNQEKELKQVQAESLQSMIAATPIDTGEARSNWRVQDIGPDGFTLVNDSPYIGVLNAGHSGQAPARFIEGVALRYGRAFGTIVNYFRS
jgi:hypothetical protein